MAVCPPAHYTSQLDTDKHTHTIKAATLTTTTTTMSTDRQQSRSDPTVMSVGAAGPPRNHPKYLPAMIPKEKPGKEVSFFIDTAQQRDGREDHVEPGSNTRIACTMIKASNSDNDSETDLDQSLPVVIICHGLYSWRNQMLLGNLASRLTKDYQCHTVRFDFAGNGHSDGDWRYGGFAREADNLGTVVDYLRDVMGCSNIVCVIGHSKGVQPILDLAVREETRSNDGLQRIPCFVALSGRYFDGCRHEDETTNDDGHDKDSSTRAVHALFTPSQIAALQTDNVVDARTPMGGRVQLTSQDLDDVTSRDSGIIQGAHQGRFLIVHGDEDEVVPVHNAARFEAAAPHGEVLIVEGADHNYNGLRHIRALAVAISSFLRKNGAIE